MTMTRQEVEERFNSIPPRRINDMQFHAPKTSNNTLWTFKLYQCTKELSSQLQVVTMNY